MPHTVKIVKVGKSDKQRTKWELRKLKKCGGSWWKKSGEKERSFILKMGDDVSGEDKNKGRSKMGI